jgi:hypothetical protein
MIKTNEKLNDFLMKIEPIDDAKKLKLSKFKHPCYIQEDHDLVKKKISTLNFIKKNHVETNSIG